MNQPQRPRARFQISIGLMLLLMVVFAIMSAGLFYGSRIPTVREEINAFRNRKSDPVEDVGHKAHKAFVMFTVASPLLLAAVLSTGVTIVRWYEQRN